MYEQEKAIARIATWGKFSGVVNIVLGAIFAITGLFNFIIGAIPGVVQVFMGYFLWKIGQEASKLKEDYMDEQAHAFLYDHLGKYLLIQGIMLIIGLVFFVIAIFFIILFGAAILSELGAF